MSERLLKHICQNVFEIFGAEIKSYINYVLRVCDNAKESHPDFPAQTKLIIRDIIRNKGKFSEEVVALRYELFALHLFRWKIANSQQPRMNSFSRSAYFQ